MTYNPYCYVDEGWCDLCDKDTIQTFAGPGHERDSSNDTRICHECGGMWHGITGEWKPSQKD